ncbi:MAG: hypothetical protein GX567_07810, partial [Clostridia bacterium]|nr:hypothetical protein [Clostridia bacterium]
DTGGIIISLSIVCFALWLAAESLELKPVWRIFIGFGCMILIGVVVNIFTSLQCAVEFHHTDTMIRKLAEEAKNGNSESVSQALNSYIKSTNRVRTAMEVTDQFREKNQAKAPEKTGASEVFEKQSKSPE